jgi:hypothetical protein
VNSESNSDGVAGLRHDSGSKTFTLAYECGGKHVPKMAILPSSVPFFKVPPTTLVLLGGLDGTLKKVRMRSSLPI